MDIQQQECEMQLNNNFQISERDVPRIIRMLMENRSLLHQILRQQTQNGRRGSNRARTSQALSEDEEELNIPGVNLPMETVEEFRQLCSWLDRNSANKRMLLHMLNEIDGETSELHVARILQRMLRNSLAQQFNWEGRKNKLKIGDSTFIKVLKKSVKESCNTSKKPTDSTIEKKVKNWLRHAKVRTRTEEKRNAKDKNDSEDDDDDDDED